jgi:hypothetical protein
VLRKWASYVIRDEVSISHFHLSLWLRGSSLKFFSIRMRLLSVNANILASRHPFRSDTNISPPVSSTNSGMGLLKHSELDLVEVRDR